MATETAGRCSQKAGTEYPAGRVWRSCPASAKDKRVKVEAIRGVRIGVASGFLRRSRKSAFVSGSAVKSFNVVPRC